MDLGNRAVGFVFLIRARDSKFIAAFDDVLAGNGTRIIKTRSDRRGRTLLPSDSSERCVAGTWTTC